MLSQFKKFKLIKYDTDFKPNTMDSRRKFWTNKSVTSYYKLMSMNTLSFQTLKEKYNLKNHDFIRYLQLRQYYFKKILKNEKTEPNEIM